MIRPLPLLAAALLGGCSGGAATSAAPGETARDAQLKGLDAQAKIDQLRSDPSLNSMERSSRISQAQKEAGLPVTGN